MNRLTEALLDWYADNKRDLTLGEALLIPTGYGFLRLFCSRREWYKDMSIFFVLSAVFLM